jgi:ribosomal protein S18 acetylase RimI-like enzyme
MISYRNIRIEDIPAVKAWPPYPPEFAGLDYSLRDGGWLDEYYPRPNTDIIVTEKSGAMAGFAILAREPPAEAELRIALHPEKLGQGLGTALARMALLHGFTKPEIDTIHLIVRKTNPRAQKLYNTLHFRHTGECIREIQGEEIEFNQMELDKKTYVMESLR